MNPTLGVLCQYPAMQAERYGVCALVAAEIVTLFLCRAEGFVAGASLSPPLLIYKPDTHGATLSSGKEQCRHRCGSVLPRLRPSPVSC